MYVTWTACPSLRACVNTPHEVVLDATACCVENKRDKAL